MMLHPTQELEPPANPVRFSFVEKHRSGKHNYFINVALVKLFLNVSDGP
jgi:hypothetical protein